MTDIIDKAEILNAKIEKLFAFAMQNDEKMKRFRQLEMLLLAQQELTGLLQQILNGCVSSCGLTDVGLVLHDPDYEIRRLINQFTPEESDERLIIVDSLALLNGVVKDKRALLLEFSPADHGWMLPKFNTEGSIAILPLWSGGRMLGCLTFASNDPNRYVGQLETDFLDHFAAVVALSIENTLNQARIRHLGLTDALTQVNNRRYFDERLRDEIERSNRTLLPLSALYLDIDFFKNVNDTYGHLIGDQVLVAVSQEMQNEIRPVDVLCRYGGEEFVALLTATPYEQALGVAERIRQRIEKLKITTNGDGDEKEIFVTLSIGVATLNSVAKQPLSKLSGSELVSQADQALYKAKHSGRNQVRGWQDLVRENRQKST